HKFRKHLTRVRETTSDMEVYVETGYVLDEFNKLFPKEFFSKDTDFLKELCNKEGISDSQSCPICGGFMCFNPRPSKKYFYVCKDLSCNGTRTKNFAPYLNDSL